MTANKLADKQQAKPVGEQGEGAAPPANSRKARQLAKKQPAQQVSLHMASAHTALICVLACLCTCDIYTDKSFPFTWPSAHTALICVLACLFTCDIYRDKSFPVCSSGVCPNSSAGNLTSRLWTVYTLWLNRHVVAHMRCDH